MKITINLILTILTFQFAIGQVATIKDPDGLTNVQKSPDRKSEIIHTIYKNDILGYVYETNDKLQNWISIYIPKNGFCLGKNGE